MEEVSTSLNPRLSLLRLFFSHRNCSLLPASDFCVSILLFMPLNTRLDGMATKTKFSPIKSPLMSYPRFSFPSSFGELRRGRSVTVPWDGMLQEKSLGYRNRGQGTGSALLITGCEISGTSLPFLRMNFLLYKVSWLDWKITKVLFSPIMLHSTFSLKCRRQITINWCTKELIRFCNSTDIFGRSTVFSGYTLARRYLTTYKKWTLPSRTRNLTDQNKSLG